MKRLGFHIFLFCVFISVPLAYFVFRTYRSLEQEEVAQLRFFAETLLNTMEEELAELVRKEEARAVDEYNVPGRFPLSRIPPGNHILGYFQNNPDGTFVTPMLEEDRIAQLKAINEQFNGKRSMASETFEAQHKTAEQVRNTEPGITNRYLSFARRQKAGLGQEKKRVEEITAEQAMNLSQRDAGYSKDEEAMTAKSQRSASYAPPSPAAKKEELAPEKLRAEVDPLQSVFVTNDRIFVFRRMVIRDQVYRQGFVLNARAFSEHLADAHFSGQPISQFAELILLVRNGTNDPISVRAGITAHSPKFRIERGFPRPFSFLQATLVCDVIPESEGRKTLNAMIAALAAIMLMGLFAIYRSARAVSELSERRSKFVSSVTHELKTPLTNIRMYIEMLEQGIARTPDREQEYYRILGSETARLSRLIGNVLEFSKLEKGQFRFDLREGSFEDVIEEVGNIMAEKLKQEGFCFEVERKELCPFVYDREVMVGVLMNLIENSMKFGKNSPVKKIRLAIRTLGKKVGISLSDTGPGIPRHALKKVFDDFYRADGNTRGTGIGLAFVKKFVIALGGSVSAANNEGAGCTITILLPI